MKVQELVLTVISDYLKLILDQTIQRLMLSKGAK